MTSNRIQGEIREGEDAALFDGELQVKPSGEAAAVQPVGCRLAKHLAFVKPSVAADCTAIEFFAIQQKVVKHVLLEAGGFRIE